MEIIVATTLALGVVGWVFYGVALARVATRIQHLETLVGQLSKQVEHAGGEVQITDDRLRMLETNVAGMREDMRNMKEILKEIANALRDKK